MTEASNPVGDPFQSQPTDPLQELKRIGERRPYFDVKAVPEPELQYVTWIDLLGAANAMTISLPRVAIFVAKIHIAAHRAVRDSKLPVKIYSVIDGFYAVSPERDAMLAFIRIVLSNLALLFVLEADNYRRFMVRCGLAFGPIVEGTGLVKGAKELADAKCYSENIAIGIAISHAYASERSAPPFGVFVHESARAFSPAKSWPIPHTYWKWAQPAEADDQLIVNALRTELNAYLNWAEANQTKILFPPGKAKELLQRVNEYFG